MEMKTREEWLAVAVERLWPTVEKHGKIPDKVHVLCSWPASNIRRTIGECFMPQWTEDGSTYIVISPRLKEPRAVLQVLLHEMIHAIGKKGHGKRFQAVCERVGLLNESKFAELIDENRSPDLNKRFIEILQEIGEYPHTVMTPPEKKKSTTTSDKKPAFMKCVSKANPEYWVYVKTSLLEKHGAPICPTSNKAMEVLKDEDDNE